MTIEICQSPRKLHRYYFPSIFVPSSTYTKLRPEHWTCSLSPCWCGSPQTPAPASAPPRWRSRSSPTSCSTQTQWSGAPGSIELPPSRCDPTTILSLQMESNHRSYTHLYLDVLEDCVDKFVTVFLCRRWRIRRSNSFKSRILFLPASDGGRWDVELLRGVRHGVAHGGLQDQRFKFFGIFSLWGTCGCGSIICIHFVLRMRKLIIIW